VLAERVAVAALGIPLLVLVVYVGGVTYDIVLGALLTIAAVELFNAFRPPRGTGQPSKATPLETAAPTDRDWASLAQWLSPMAALTGLASAALVAGADSGYDWFVFAMAGAVGATLLLLVVTSNIENGAPDWSAALVAIAYVGFLGAHFALLRDLHDGREFVFLVLLATWSTDSFAYLVGKTVGRQKFTPRISPNKTWEGTLAGVAGGFGVVLLLNWLLDLELTAAEVVPLALLFPIFAVAGDLAESMLKRSLGVKDMSNLIPGHGGVVDRLDSLLFTCGLVYYWLIWVVD
jgi:phosphatidate cytidylyltransferase